MPSLDIARVRQPHTTPARAGTRKRGWNTRGRCGHLLGSSPGSDQAVTPAAVWPARCGRLLGSGPGSDHVSGTGAGYASGGGQRTTWHRRNHCCAPFPNRAATAVISRSRERSSRRRRHSCPGSRSAPSHSWNSVEPTLVAGDGHREQQVVGQLVQCGLEFGADAVGTSQIVQVGAGVSEQPDGTS